MLPASELKLAASATAGKSSSADRLKSKEFQSDARPSRSNAPGSAKINQAVAVTCYYD
jgi:hypothetical protein